MESGGDPAERSGHAHAPAQAHAHAHAHGAAVRAGARHLRRLWMAFALIAVFFVVEAVGGLLTNSLALLSDAAHMLTDLLGLGMALAAIHVANRPIQRAQHTFGLYRLEILAALANAVLLLGVGVYVLVEAIQRVRHPEEVLGVEMLVIAVVGLVVNVVAMAWLRPGSKESLNVRGAYLEVLADLLSSVGVIIAAVIVGSTGWTYADPLIAAAIGLFIFPRTFRLGGQALRVLVQAAPPGIDVEEVRAQLAALPTVVDVHDLHLWTLTSDMEVASAHLMITDGADSHAVLDQARAVLAGRFGIDHATLQVEPESHTGCDEVTW
ncbi:cation diffusion facilitator family transporter [Rhabdothermincola sp.]|uniref:cation diffusion facilitator family transporter n=1 Tax=Rhabdothermincola sp. TaxID=2820405 RepID=UPI002FDFBD8A